MGNVRDVQDECTGSDLNCFEDFELSYLNTMIFQSVRRSEKYIENLSSPFIYLYVEEEYFIDY
jgi:hypothetical protein